MRVLVIGGRKLGVKVCKRWASRVDIKRILYIDDQPLNESLDKYIEQGTVVYRQQTLNELGYHNVTRNIDRIVYLGLYNLITEYDPVKVMMQSLQTCYQIIGIAEVSRVPCDVVYPLQNHWPLNKLEETLKLLCDCHRNRTVDEQSEESPCTERSEGFSVNFVVLSCDFIMNTFN